MLRSALRRRNFGVYTTRGVRQQNEDRYRAYTLPNGLKFYGIYDGHGGSAASEYCSQHLHLELEDRLKTEGISDALKKSFMAIDFDFRALQEDKSKDGTTATVALIQDRTLHLGHIGDTRLVACDVKSGVATQLTVDHSPDVKVERQRVEKAGGFVIADSFGQVNAMGVLGVTRSIGVQFLKKQYGDQVVTCQPDIKENVDLDGIAFLVMLSDGIYSVMSNQEVADIIKHCKEPEAAAFALVDIAERYGSKDNCTALVIRCNEDRWPHDSVPQTTRDFTLNLRRFKLRHTAQGTRNSGMGGFSAHYRNLDEDMIEDLFGPSEEFNNAKDVKKEVRKIKRDYMEVPLNRFIVELFDAAGKDSGSSVIFQTQGDRHVQGMEEDQTRDTSADKYEFPSKQQVDHKLSLKDLTESLQKLEVSFKQKQSDETAQELRLEQFIKIAIPNDIEVTGSELAQRIALNKIRILKHK